MTDRLGPQIERLFEVGAPPLTLGELGQVRTSSRPPSALRPVLAGVALVVLAVGVTLGISRLQPGPLAPGSVCVEPPAEELARVSPRTMTIDPNPVAAGAEADLTVDGSVGIRALWQCWNGEQWVHTHLLSRAGGPPTEHQSGSLPPVFGIGFGPGAPIKVVVPNVPSGTYRIADETLEGPTEVFVVVRVVEILPPTTGPEAEDEGSLCPNVAPLYPGANSLPEGAEVIAEFPFRDGTLHLYRSEGDLTYFGVVECFTGGGGGFSAGGPGESWQGCYRWDYSAAGYGIVTVEDPTWLIEVNGASVPLQEVEGGVGLGFLESVEPPLNVTILTEEECATTSTTTTQPVAGEPFDPGPLQGRGGHSVVWTGDEMIVWGGMGSEIGRPLFADGAAFDPETDAWRIIAEAPLLATFFHHAAWTGTEMLIVSGPGRRDGAAYDPATNSWRPIAEAPFPLATASEEDPTEFSSSVWTGERLVIWEVRGDRAAAYSPGSDTWEVLPGVGIGAVRGALRWTGEEVVAIGIGADGAILGPLQGARLQGGEWVSLPPVDTPDLRPMLSAWTGTDLTVWTEEGVARAYVPATDSWEHRESFSLPGCEGLAPPLEMPGRGVLLFEWCGVDTFYEPSADARTPVNLWGLGHQRWAVWTGREVLSWGDTCCYGTGAPFAVAAWRWTPPN